MKTGNKMDKNEILNQVKIAVMGYPMKAMADELDKAYSTLSNELDHRDTAKLGFLTALGILAKSQGAGAPSQSRYAGIKAVDLIEAGFGRVAFELPKAIPTDPRPIMQMAAKLSKEFGEAVQELASCIDPESPGGGRTIAEEAERCLKEIGDLVKACIELQGYFQCLQADSRKG